ncbi:cation diffusion facilitator family transporter [Tenacibaculum sp. IB213877]|uniref:cation diffusion facilitator family transporter n=1 Tax=Tenacibaculum sp. IB213877 TaxID=3097351 RepID=UPI002A5ADEC6|nr:cation diffusion facilitator family transporter [Tenacibaculum sp. IB213877]MDY0779422.1 cation diffusion facilitator family transporter [Tenacibaculum sp. IB213877]
MGHNHHHHSHDASTENIKTAFFLNLFFTIIEFVGGFFTNSLAIMSDALHDLGDSITLGASWYFQKLSTKEANKKYSYGYKRFSLLGAIINSVILIIGSIFIIKEAIPRITNPQQADANGMMWLAILGVIVNGVAVFKLRQGNSINERVVSLHLLEDVLGWIAVLVASIVMQFWDVPILDPILSLLIALFVLYNVVRNMKDSLQIILMATPKEVSIENVKEKLLMFDGVVDAHDIKLWTLDGESNILTAHIVVSDEIHIPNKTETLKQNIKHSLLDNFGVKHITLELERKEEDCEYRNQ